MIPGVGRREGEAPAEPLAELLCGSAGASPSQNRARRFRAGGASGVQPATEPPSQGVRFFFVAAPADAADAEAEAGAAQAVPAEAAAGGPGEPAGSPPEIVVAVGSGEITIASEDLDALDEFEALVTSIADQMATSGEKFTVFYLKYARADVAAELLQEVLGGGGSDSGAGGGSLLGDLAGGMLGGGGAGGLMGTLLGLGGGGGGGGDDMSLETTGAVTVVPDLRLNALIVQANPTDLDLIKQLLDVIDLEASPEKVETISPPKLIPVLYTNANEIAEVVRQVFAQQITNSSGGQRQPSPEEFIRMLRGGRGRDGGSSRAAGTTNDGWRGRAEQLAGRVGPRTLVAPGRGSGRAVGQGGCGVGADDAGGEDSEGGPRDRRAGAPFDAQSSPVLFDQPHTNLFGGLAVGVQPGFPIRIVFRRPDAATDADVQRPPGSGRLGPGTAAHTRPLVRTFPRTLTSIGRGLAGWCVIHPKLRQRHGACPLIFGECLNGWCITSAQCITSARLPPVRFDATMAIGRTQSRRPPMPTIQLTFEQVAEAVRQLPESDRRRLLNEVSPRPDPQAMARQRIGCARSIERSPGSRSECRNCSPRVAPAS